MIGAIFEPSEATVAEEFFQLFKTPWEVYREGKSYDVVITTGDRIPTTEPTLLVVYGSRRSPCDEQGSNAGSLRLPEAVVNYSGTQLPIFGELQTFWPADSRTPVAIVAETIAGFKVTTTDRSMLRLGYDLFREVEFLLCRGQPAEWARVPALEIHIKILRDAILTSGITLLEIPPIPSRHAFVVCLTHDIDFVGIRNHKFDHSMWGFLYRSTVGGLREFLRRRISLGRLLRMWRAAASLPLVLVGLIKDFWLPFEWYLRIEKALPVTYFLVPFKNRPGDKLGMRNPERRATKYDVSDIPEWIAVLRREGCEVAVHGIDSWHSVQRAQEEIGRLAAPDRPSHIGVRMHWLMQDEHTYRVLDEAGYAYDSTAGYNETIGYRCGTTQVFRPPGTIRLLELPLHIQDGALFFPRHLALAESEAWTECAAMIARVRELGGVLTVLWHDRSHGPERFWGDFYIRLLSELRASNAWFGNASQVVEWFRKREGCLLCRNPVGRRKRLHRSVL